MNNSNASNTQQANLIDTVAAQGTLGTFSKAINAAGLANILNVRGGHGIGVVCGLAGWPF